MHARLTQTRTKRAVAIRTVNEGRRAEGVATIGGTLSACAEQQSEQFDKPN